MALVSGDSTTLFTSSGMQQFVPYLLGEVHPLGTRIFDVQPSLRSQDIEEVGDNRHTTAFEMLGNWSLGDYFKKEQLQWFFTFLTDPKWMGIPKERIYVSVFAGDKNANVAKDEESIEIWKELFKSAGMDIVVGDYTKGIRSNEERIFVYDAKKNWWSRAGVPEKMPAGEPGGPDSEVFYDFGADLKFHENSQWAHEPCHPNCDCGRFMEIGNSVFMQYVKQDDGSFKPLPKPNVDFGGGLERILAAQNNMPDVFKTDILSTIILAIEAVTNKSYNDDVNKPAMRIIADHLKASTFLIIEGVKPANKEQGYVLRRLMRRALVKFYNLIGQPVHAEEVVKVCLSVAQTYNGVYFDENKVRPIITEVVSEEVTKFAKSLSNGLKEIQKKDHIDGKVAFDIYQSYGFPFELIEELAIEKGEQINKDEFRAEFEKHKNLSRTASAGMFKGGLADNSEQVLKYHTATHLLHQALFDVLGDDVRQDGSNITAERLRFDFTAPHKPTEEEVKKIETIINDKIKEALPMRFMIMPKEEALKVGAKSFFKEKYPDQVKVYYIGGKDDHPETAYSKEFCGGPHVTNTKEIGTLEIYKVEKIGSNIFRIYAK
jgi:alanyl-tRNA synthetase